MKQSEIILAGVTAAVVSSVIGWSYVASPTIERWRAATEREETNRDKVERYKALILKGPEFRGERMAIESVLHMVPVAGEESEKTDPGVATANSGGDAIGAFLAHLNALTEAAGFKASNLHFVRGEPFDAFSELRFELKAKAPLKQIQDFLVRMTASDWYFRVQSLAITPREGTDVEADMSLVALAAADAVETPESGKRGGRQR